MELKVSEAKERMPVIIRKGYYPAKLVAVDILADKEGNPKLFTGKSYQGHKLLFKFEIWKDNNGKAPVEKIKQEDREDVILPLFPYYEYINEDKSINSAITPNSSLTKILTVLGWTFDTTKPVNPKDFIGNWIEANVDDNTYKDVTSSQIKDYNKYEGEVPKEEKMDEGEVAELEEINVGEDL